MNILEKYSELPKDKKSTASIWQRVAFGKGEMQDLCNMRLELVTHTNVITMLLNVLLLGSQGRVESYLNESGERSLRTSAIGRLDCGIPTGGSL